MDKIIVIDYGSQYNELIVRRLRDLNVESYLYPSTFSYEEALKIEDLKGIILSGGFDSVSNESLTFNEELLKLNVPILGICYGMELLSFFLKGNINKAKNSEYGRSLINVDNTSKIFKDLPENFNVWMSHSDSVSFNDDQLKDDLKIIAKNINEEVVGFSYKENMFGLLFHPEVNNTEFSKEIFLNFIDICGAKREYKMDTFIEDQIKEIKEKVGNKKVILGLSGGVDSAVCALLLHKAIGNQLIPVFIDHGLNRKFEKEELEERFINNLHLNVLIKDYSELFLSRLKGVTDPETKRKIIGKTFIDCFSEVANSLEGVEFLAQGTLYTDIVESGKGGISKVIKSHHNVGGLPKDLKFSLIEPLKTLYKDQVREVGTILGLDKEFLYRQPFPGPGLGIRVIGEITKEKLDILKDADYILREEVKKNNLTNDIWQYFTVLTNIKSVGVMGDNRTYSYALAIRCVTSIDGMTADFYRMNYEIIAKISSRIVNEVKGINRILYDVTSKPPSTIEYE